MARSYTIRVWSPHTLQQAIITAFKDAPLARLSHIGELSGVGTGVHMPNTSSVILLGEWEKAGYIKSVQIKSDATRVAKFLTPGDKYAEFESLELSKEQIPHRSGRTKKVKTTPRLDKHLGSVSNLKVLLEALTTEIGYISYRLERKDEVIKGLQEQIVSLKAERGDPPTPHLKEVDRSWTEKIFGRHI